jgi:DNA replication protein DnaC
LFEALMLAHADGTHIELLARFAKIDVLFIDDFALSPSATRIVVTF